ncbi:hypothetical protein FAZ19_04495 [Sphingobacterium alkalisoli]|uniref:Peptidyl-prolyl cis-trans isomerase n=1 Tax=Sphingobacterium alkalisoli TaxID=1874115 RepID=A0A4U0H9J1_9SPHI|nr:FKBP-type peptidyl-prolyl cis-trans isomerase [Sphingobacterium alkalisoli]TJY68520.1 hypothetical protein FAZ19_04495 [Sphingobacterium alkalisoli]GGH05912.1 hypothetical protein GCM10011418_02370 [Sphingobacterium alkalisoli]
MKNLLKPLFAFAIVATTFTSCMEKDDTDYDAIYLREEQIIDSIFSAQKLVIEDYVDMHFDNAKEDTIKLTYRYLNKSIKRGIWFEVLSEPTDDTYEYKVNPNSTQGAPIYPKWKLKYKASLLNGTVVQEDSEGTEYSFNTNNPNVYNNAWFISFIPYSLKYSGKDFIYEGLTKNGLKKGSKFRMVTPSYFAFASTAKDKIPANSPLVYEFEVLEIE